MFSIFSQPHVSPTWRLTQGAGQVTLPWKCICQMLWQRTKYISRFCFKILLLVHGCTITIHCALFNVTFIFSILFWTATHWRRWKFPKGSEWQNKKRVQGTRNHFSIQPPGFWPDLLITAKCLSLKIFFTSNIIVILCNFSVDFRLFKTKKSSFYVLMTIWIICGCYLWRGFHAVDAVLALHGC